MDSDIDEIKIILAKATKEYSLLEYSDKASGMGKLNKHLLDCLELMALEIEEIKDKNYHNSSEYRMAANE